MIQTLKNIEKLTLKMNQNILTSKRKEKSLFPEKNSFIKSLQPFYLVSMARTRRMVILARCQFQDTQWRKMKMQQMNPSSSPTHWCHSLWRKPLTINHVICKWREWEARNGQATMQKWRKPSTLTRRGCFVRRRFLFLSTSRKLSEVEGKK